MRGVRNKAIVELGGFFCYCFAFLLSSRICSCFSKLEIMPFDTKRINGPEVSFDYKKFIKDRKAKNAEKYRREKDRKNDDEHRKICKTLRLKILIFSLLIFQSFSFKNWNDYKGQRLSLHRTRPNQSHLCSLWSTRDSKTFRFFHERNPKLHI